MNSLCGPLRLYCCLLSLVIAVWVEVSRIGLPAAPFPVLARGVGLSFFLLCGVSRVHEPVFATLIALSIALVIGATTLPVGDVLCAAGYVGFILAVKKSPRAVRLLPLSGVAGIGFFLCARLWGTGHHYPDLLERIGYLWTNPDRILFPGSAKLLETYGVLTTGIDGLVPIRYHLGSHLSFLHLSKLLRIDVLDFYVFVYPVVVVPLLVFSVASAALHSMRLDHSSSRVETLFFGVAAVLLSPPVLMAPLYPSESYTVAILFACLTFAAMVLLWKSGMKARILVLFLFPLFFAALTTLRVSCGVTLSAAYCYFVVRRYMHPYRLALCSAALTVTAVLYTLSRTLTEGKLAFGFLSVARDQSPSFLPVFFALPSLYLGIRIRDLKLTSLSKLRYALKTRAAPDVEIVSALTLGGLVVVGAIELIDHNELYFAADASLAAAVLLASRAGRLTQFRLPSRAVYRAVLLIVALLSADSLRISAQNWMTSALRLRMHIYSRALGHSATSLSELLEHAPRLLQSDPLYRLLVDLRSLHGLAVETRRQSALFIPQSNSRYWSAFPCYNAPLVAVALTGLALVDGRPPASCSVQSLGYAAYPRRTSRQDDLSEDALCEQAQLRGFRYVLRLSDLSSPAWLECKPHQTHLGSADR